eukprot:480359_1
MNDNQQWELINTGKYYSDKWFQLKNKKSLCCIFINVTQYITQPNNIKFGCVNCDSFTQNETYFETEDIDATYFRFKNIQYNMCMFQSSDGRFGVVGCQGKIYTDQQWTWVILSKSPTSVPTTTPFMSPSVSPTTSIPTTIPTIVPTLSPVTMTPTWRGEGAVDEETTNIIIVSVVNDNKGIQDEKNMNGLFSGMRWIFVILVGIAVLLLIVIFVLCCVFYRRYIKRKNNYGETTNRIAMVKVNSGSDLHVSGNNKSKSNVIAAINVNNITTDGNIETLGGDALMLMTAGNENEHLNNVEDQGNVIEKTEASVEDNEHSDDDLYLNSNTATANVETIGKGNDIGL